MPTYYLHFSVLAHFNSESSLERYGRSLTITVTTTVRQMLILCLCNGNTVLPLRNSVYVLCFLVFLFNGFFVVLVHSINLEMIAEKQHSMPKKCPFNLASLAATACMIDSVSMCLWRCHSFSIVNHCCYSYLRKTVSLIPQRKTKTPLFNYTDGQLSH